MLSLSLRKCSFAVTAILATGALEGGCILGSVEDPPRPELPLPIPPVLEPTRREGNTDFYTIVQKRGIAQTTPNPKRLTAVEGYNGIWPGPTIHATAGREVVVNQVNELDHPVVVHNHGHNVAPESDGHPVDFIMPGASRDYVYPNRQHAGTYWLHDHTMHQTSRNIWNGLSMFYIIHDSVWDSLNLPSGEFDVPLLIADRSFNLDGSFYYPGPGDENKCIDGVECNAGPEFGDTLTVNGARTPVFEVAARKYLFRILNASDHRVYRWSMQRLDHVLANDAVLEPFTVVASDGGLLPRPVPREDIVLGPAERYNIVIDFSKYPIGTHILVRNVGADAETGNPRTPRLPQIMRFVVTRTAPDTSVIPDVLMPIERLDPNEAVATHHVELSRTDSEVVGHAGNWFLNGKFFDPARIDVESKLNTTEIWEFENKTTFPHTMHSHLVQFQILDNNGALRPEESGWKDTILIRPETSARIILRWTGFTGLYVFHCHVIGHEDNSMMMQVRISE